MPTTLAEIAENARNIHFIGFFDVNDTVFLGDSEKRVDREIATLKALAENYSSIWDPEKTTEVMTYKKFVEQYLASGDKRDSAVEAARNALYKNFINFLKETNNPLLVDIETQYHQIQKNLQGGCIASSFINLIRELEENGYQYTIIFRTFGKDIKAVTDELSQKTHIKKFKLADVKAGQLHIDEDLVVQTPAELLAHIKPFEHAAWRDSFLDWKATGETYTGGKPYPVNLEDKSTMTIFFDDNVGKQIVRVIPVNGDVFEQQALQDELKSANRLVSVNTRDAFVNPDYYTQRVVLAYQKLLLGLSPSPATIQREGLKRFGQFKSPVPTRVDVSLEDVNKLTA
ncbi:hypothetical protein Lsan_3496 [Legionella santicrucis]|uniref:Uncharacterized protein n=1 Tax=Legionella santicrucis TaxID=45074 RepID=A0A0W0YA78_9GAMM|nr:hypothetical protein [Legionella santicrucis]KTD53832.1 hypothetical protein Lsan_3496 [Legionella santicrucis]